MSRWQNCPSSISGMSFASSGIVRTTSSVDFGGPPRRLPIPPHPLPPLRAYLQHRATSTRVGAAQTPPPLPPPSRPPLRRCLRSPNHATRARAVRVEVSRTRRTRTILASSGSPPSRTSTTPVLTSPTTNHGGSRCRYSKPGHLSCRRTLSSTHQRLIYSAPTDNKVDAFWSTMPTAVSLGHCPLALNRTQHRPTSRTTLYQEEMEDVWRR